ncbi:MAG: glycogen/starch/alpha-glucan phosphorylase [Puniceicoccales bacterium]|jgi:starch phosphorylase|nr:glycogen/starch/alpha-glucan phosphorylase [Puniceicoccales bacterium]
MTKELKKSDVGESNSTKDIKEVFFIDSSVDEFKILIKRHLNCTLAREPSSATKHDWWVASCYALRDKILDRFIKTQIVHHKANTKRLYYLSLEYLTGQLFINNLHNSGAFENLSTALKEFGQDIEEISKEGPDPGLGNGGLGRLAACFLDSLATLNYPAIGYGIHYEFGLFKQEIINGQQVERPDSWMASGDNPWQIARPENAQRVKLYGRVESHFNEKGDWEPRWIDTRDVVGIPWDIPVVGYGAETVNFLRLWESKATEDFNLDEFNRGDYIDAVHGKAVGETISKVLYPNDSTEQGKELRLVQQYFFVSCSIKDILRRYKNAHSGWQNFAKTTAIQLNDTHPAVAVLELMRLLVDREGVDWDMAWQMCQSVFGYTNHTLLPEALETWSVGLFKNVLPRHYQIVCEINKRFLETDVQKTWPNDDQKKRDLSIISSGDNQVIRMAYLSVVACHSVTGVAAMHSDLLKTQLFKDFYQMYPDKFNNKTNGITPRRWLKLCNQELSALIDSKIGKNWTTNLDKLRLLEQFAGDTEFQNEFLEIKHNNKVKLAKIIEELCGITVSPYAVFDVQIKRLHEYKRQHLNLLHIITLYYRLLHSQTDIHPTVFIFSAKAAPGYRMAKTIIHAINVAGKLINNCVTIDNKIKVVFIPNYCVSLAEKIIPAADVSEQISTAGKEASGTGNMKLALNGACTIGTLDGANVEIKEEVGDENIFIFGKTEAEIANLRQQGYNPWDYYHSNGELRAILDWMRSDFFQINHGSNPIKEVAENLLNNGDPFFVLADYEDYCKTQKLINKTYSNRQAWAKMAIYNTARVGKFSSDRTIMEYANDIWALSPLKIGK